MNAATRQFVRERAANRCEYCRLPQAAAPFLTFHVEHIQASQHIRDDSSENLCLACPHCNLHKGPNLTTLHPETRDVILLFHPRQNRWEEHFSFRGSQIVGLTDIGRATAALLKMNDDDLIEVRKELIRRGEM